MRKDHKVMRFLWTFLMLTVGSVIYALGVAYFLDPLDLAPGGLTGIGIILDNFIPLGPGIIVFILNVPILVVGLKKFGKEFLFSTCYSTILISVLMDIFRQWNHEMALTQDRMLAALAGGVCLAVGMGIVFRCGGTTGGVDVIIKLVHLKYRHVRTGTILLIIDFTIITASVIALKNIEIGLYAIVALFVNSMVFDLVLYGTDEAKLVYIVSNHHEEVADRLLKEISVGVTFLEGEGAYTREDKRVLMTVSKKQNFPKIKDVVKEVDPQAFMIVTSATEVFGVGFKNAHHEEL